AGSGLAACSAQQIEIFPVERAAVVGRRQQYQSDEPLLMDQRHSGPSLFLPEQGLRDVQLAVSSIGPAATKSVEIDDPALGADRQPEPKGLGGRNCGAEIGATRPIPG